GSPDASDTAFAACREILPIRTERHGRRFASRTEAGDLLRGSLPDILAQVPYSGGVVVGGRRQLLSIRAENDLAYFSRVMQFREVHGIQSLYHAHVVAGGQRQVVVVVAECDGSDGVL